MSIKISLFLTILCFATIHSQSLSLSSNDQNTLQREIFLGIHTHDRISWISTPPEQNIQFLPLSAEVSTKIFQIDYYYESGLGTSNYSYFQKDEYLRTAYAFGNTIDSFQKSSNVKLNISNAVFYNERNTTQQFLDDVKTYYRAEVYKSSFDSTNTSNLTILASINEWISKHTNGRGHKLNHLITSDKSYLEISSLSFTGCWDKSKTSANLIKGLKFKTPKEEITLDAFQANEKIGYYNNSELRYEAIRLPYKNNEFAIAIVLPYQDHQSLELFITIKDPKKYQEMFNNINEHEENIEYTIPTIHLSSLSLNEKGTNVNGDNAIVCESSAPNEDQHPITNNTLYKSFYVNRPFAVFIYDVRTKFILVHALVKNPTSDYSSLNTLADGNSPNTQVLRYQSSNFYEFLQLYLHNAEFWRRARISWRT